MLSLGTVVGLSYATENNIKQRKYFWRNFIKNNCYFCITLYVVAMERNAADR